MNVERVADSRAVTAVTARNRANKRRGAKFETDLVDYLRSQPHIQDTERLPKAGRDDEGDLTFTAANGRYCVEAKDVAKLNLSGWLKEAWTEAANYARKRGHAIGPIPVVIVKARQRVLQESYVVMRLEDFLDIA